MFLRANYPTIINDFRGVFVFSAGLKLESVGNKETGKKFYIHSI